MLHELLLALLGKTGNIVTEQDETFKINPDYDKISEPEREILNKICILGYYYMRIEKFLDENHKIFSDISLQLLINTKDIEENQNGFDQSNPLGSAYIKAFCYGVEEIMEEYQNKILEIERIYLNERVFTYSSLSVKLSDYFYILPEINYLIEKIIAENLKGGQVIDLLQAGLLTGNAIVRDVHKRILKYCYKVLFHQIIGWIVYGKLLDLYNEFFIYKVENKKIDDINTNYQLSFGETKIANGSMANVLNKKENPLEKTNNFEADWDTVFSLKFSMLPQSILSIKLAEKILFIGKAQRVLNFNKHTNEHFSNDSIKVLQQLSSSDIIDTLLFQEKLTDHLKNLKNYYFLGKGEFFQIFVEESRSLMKLPPTANAENEVNGIVYQNTLMRLNWDDSKITKPIRFKLNKNGFEFNNFNSIQGLSVIGNVNQKKNNNYVRFDQMKTAKESGCVWYNIKQNLENGFKMSFSLRFKRATSAGLGVTKLLSPKIATSISRISTNIDPTSPNRMSIESPHKGSMAKDDSTTSNTTLCLVFQNGKEINSWKKHAPTSLKEMNEYLAVKFTLLDQSSRLKSILSSNENSKSLVSVSYFSKDKNYRVASKENVDKNYETKLGELAFNNENLNFSEEDLHVFKIHYDGEHLIIYKDDFNTPSLAQADNVADLPFLKVPLKMSQVMHLDMGKAYTGFVQESQNGSFFVDILSWKMNGYNIYNNEDTWSGLTVDYATKWPLNLFLSNQILEKYSNIFRYLFPMRCLQIELHKAWLNSTKANRLYVLNQTNIKILHLRNQMSFFLDNLWSYFHLDVLDVQWNKLDEAINNAKDFEELRKVHELYLTSISNQIFLSFPVIVKSIFAVVTQCRKLINLVARTELGMNKHEMEEEYYHIRRDFDIASSDLLAIITLLNKNQNSPYLYQLLLRLDYNGYFTKSQV